MHQELIDYIKNAQGVGKADWEIRADLFKIGWRKEDIDEAFGAIFYGGQEQYEKKMQYANNLGRFFGIVVFLAFGIWILVNPYFKSILVVQIFGLAILIGVILEFLSYDWKNKKFRSWSSFVRKRKYEAGLTETGLSTQKERPLSIQEISVQTSILKRWINQNRDLKEKITLALLVILILSRFIVPGDLILSFKDKAWLVTNYGILSILADLISVGIYVFAIGALYTVIYLRHKRFKKLGLSPIRATLIEIFLGAFVGVVAAVSLTAPAWTVDFGIFVLPQIIIAGAISGILLVQPIVELGISLRAIRWLGYFLIIISVLIFTRFFILPLYLPTNNSGLKSSEQRIPPQQEIEEVPVPVSKQIVLSPSEQTSQLYSTNGRYLAYNADIGAKGVLECGHKIVTGISSEVRIFDTIKNKDALVVRDLNLGFSPANWSSDSQWLLIIAGPPRRLVETDNCFSDNYNNFVVYNVTTGELQRKQRNTEEFIKDSTKVCSILFPDPKVASFCYDVVDGDWKFFNSNEDPSIIPAISFKYPQEFTDFQVLSSRSRSAPEFILEGWIGIIYSKNFIDLELWQVPNTVFEDFVKKIIYSPRAEVKYFSTIDGLRVARIRCSVLNERGECFNSQEYIIELAKNNLLKINVDADDIPRISLPNLGFPDDKDGFSTLDKIITTIKLIP